MKKNYFLTILMLIAFNYAFAQTPQAINYQGVARDNSGNIIASHLVALRLSVVSSSTTGTVVYTETHSKTTDAYGLFSLQIGQGNLISGSFTSINWGNNSYFLKVEIDPTGGTNYQLAGVSQFASVPYAMYATTSGGSAPGNNPGDMLFWNGTAWVVVPAGVHGQTLTFCNGVPTWGGCPPLVSTAAASSLTSTSVSCGGDVTNDGGASVTVRGICYSTSPNPTIANSIVASGTGNGSFISNITALSSGTTYYIKAFATNSNGTAYGNQITITTLALPIVTTTNASSITSTTAQSGGNVSSDGGASITARGVCYSTSSTPTIANNIVAGGTGIGSFTSNITGLTMGTTYHIRAYATNSVGTAYGDDISFTTLALPIITTTAATSITSSTATSGGNVSNDGGATVTTRGVCYGTSSNPTTANSIVAGGTGTGSFTANLTALSPNTLYFVRAFATNSVGTAYGDEVMLTTLSNLPTLTTNAIDSITTTTARTGGNITNDGGDSNTARGICYDTVSSPTILKNILHSGTGSGSFIAKLTGLIVNKTYYVRAYATNSAGTAYGNEIGFTTSNITLNVGLVAYYPFNGNANDSSGNGNNGTDNGATLTTDRFGNINSAYSFNGVDNYILINDPVPTSLQIQNEITISAWIYVTQYPASNTLGLIVGSQNDNYGHGATIFLDGRTNPDWQTAPAGHIHFQIGNGSWHTVHTNSQVPMNQWVNIVATRKANEDAKIYYNGILQPLTSVGWDGSISYTGSYFAIGRQRDYSDRFFNGKIDDIRIYNRALNVIEITTLYNEEGKPIVNNTNSVTNISQISAICGGNIASDGGSNITARGVCWSTSSDPTTNNSITADGADTGSFTSNITGLTPNTLYYVRAYATNSMGTSYGNQVSFTTLQALGIGQTYQGGIIAYILQPGDFGYDANVSHGLITAPSDQGSANWGSYITTGATATSLGTGNSNTNTIVAIYGVGNYAAKLCYDLVLNGYTDWYLPSNDELLKLYNNRVILGGFSGRYWSSSEYIYNDGALEIDFSSVSGFMGSALKNNSYNVRAVRSF